MLHEVTLPAGGGTQLTLTPHGCPPSDDGEHRYIKSFRAWPAVRNSTPPDQSWLTCAVMDWTRWHQAYEDPQSSHSQRLAVVQTAICDWVDSQPPGPLRLVSACAGQGRDVVGALRDHPRRADVTGVLVEYDADVATQARSSIREAELTGIQVLVGDAGNTSAYTGWTPADLLLFCGVFGNISDQDVHRTIEMLPAFCAPTATVTWTRHRVAPDLTPQVRSWFAEAGFEEVAFISPGENRFAVGVHRLVRSPMAFAPDRQLFTFTR